MRLLVGLDGGIVSETSLFYMLFLFENETFYCSWFGDVCVMAISFLLYIK